MLAVALLGTVLLAYSNHFHNPFEFDDSHTIETNAAIRDLRNVPTVLRGRNHRQHPGELRLPAGADDPQCHRLRHGGRTQSLHFHRSIFISYLILGLLLYLFYLRIGQMAADRPWLKLLALGATGWFMLHTANAETINYIIQRGDSFSTLMVVLGLVIYMYKPAWRKYGLYLIPLVIGFLTKTPALMFVPLLFVYSLLFERDPGLTASVRARQVAEGAQVAHRRAAGLPGGSRPGAAEQRDEPRLSLSHQPARIQLPDHAALRFRALLQQLPLAAPVQCRHGLAAAAHPDRRQVLRRRGFHLADARHRGLRVAAQRRAGRSRSASSGSSSPCSPPPASSRWTRSSTTTGRSSRTSAWCWPSVGRSGCSSCATRRPSRDPGCARSSCSCCLVAALLLGNAYGAYQRNQVWSSDGVALVRRYGQQPRQRPGADELRPDPDGEGQDTTSPWTTYNRALPLVPNYSFLHINLGIVYGAMNQPAEAERYFQARAAARPGQRSTRLLLRPVAAPGGQG